MVCACWLLAACAGVEFYPEDALEAGRQQGRELVGDVEAGRFTWDQADETCNVTADAMRLDDSFSDNFIDAVQMGCHQAISDAKEAAGH